MAIVFFFLFLIVVPNCLGCNARTMPKNKAKIVEEYVIKAKFDEKKNLPQLTEINQFKEDEAEAKHSSLLLPLSSRGNHKDSEQMIDDFEDRNTLEERDLLVHHHHVPPLVHPPPPPPPVPPPPPPPVGLAYAPSLFAIGLITFLILLNSLQTSLLLILKSKGSVLGTVTGALGRKKRFAFENEKLALYLTRGRS